MWIMCQSCAGWMCAWVFGCYNPRAMACGWRRRWPQGKHIAYGLMWLRKCEHDRRDSISNFIRLCEMRSIGQEKMTKISNFWLIFFPFFFRFDRLRMAEWRPTKCQPSHHWLEYRKSTTSGIRICRGNWMGRLRAVEQSRGRHNIAQHLMVLAPPVSFQIQLVDISIFEFSSRWWRHWFQMRWLTRRLLCFN